MRWLSLSTCCITVVGTYLLGSSAGDNLYAAAHPLPSSFLKAQVRRSASATAITSMFPRGGASKIPKQDKIPSSPSSTVAAFARSTRSSQEVVVSSSSRTEENENMAKRTTSWIRGGSESLMTSRAKLGWRVAFVLSVIYLILLLSKVAPSCNYSLDGFCVTNYDPIAKSCEPQNSHVWAWKEDVIFTVAAFLLQIVIDPKAGPMAWVKVLGVAVAIFSHGFLHRSLADCATPPSGPNILGNLAYGAFTAFISFLILTMGGLDTKTVTNIAITIVVTIVTVSLSQPNRHLGVSPIFMTTQLLASGVGAFSKAPPSMVNSLTGDLFIAPCLVSIIELMCCCNGDSDRGWFNKLGGHAWYDFFLHISILSTLLPDKSKSVE
eukprot:scaffold189961_cov29-Attheya_sp.AAC.1